MASSNGADVEWAQGDATFDVDLMPVFSNTEINDLGVRGVVLVTQTCDALRKPYVQVAALREVSAGELEEIRKYRRPQFAYLPHLASQHLVADLDLVTTYDRSVLAQWTRIPFEGDAFARRDLAFAIGRHRTRPVFPDEWATAFGRLRNWLREKAGKDSPEGRFASAVDQLRIVADDVPVPAHAVIYCIIPDDTEAAQREQWSGEILPKLGPMIDPSWKCEVAFELKSVATMTAAGYVTSRRMDFDAMTRTNT